MSNYSAKLVLLLVLGGLLSLFGCLKGHATPTYDGRDKAAAWRRSAAERIERIRKANLSVEVVDRNGRPLPGAQIDLRMLRHSFSFGSAVTAHDLIDESPNGRRYREIVEGAYNKVVLENDLKWGQWEYSLRKQPGDVYNIDSTLKALKWLGDRGILVRGHYIAWGNLGGDETTVEKANSLGPLFRDFILRHAEQKVKAVGDAVSEWDVVNHPIGWVPKTIRDAAGEDIYDVMFQKVKDWNPNPRRDLNEGGILSDSGRNKNRKEYYELIEGMLKRGMPVQGVGFMGHFLAEKDLTPPEKLLEILDQYARLGLPLQITEFDVRFGKAGQLVALNSMQEQLQADYLRDFLTVMFSHPAVTGVMMWGFWEGRHWYPSAALYRKDWSIKPNGRQWEDLVLRQWWTNETGTADARGRYATRGFLGDYLVSVKYRGQREVVKRLKLDPSGATVRVVVR